MDKEPVGRLERSTAHQWTGMRIGVLAITLGFLVGCGPSQKPGPDTNVHDRHREKAEIPDAKGPMTPFATVGHYSVKEVEQLRVQIREMKFPVPADTVMQLVSQDIVPDPIAFYDGLGGGNGRMRDFWLNKETVLRVAECYVREKPSQEVWAEIINRRDLNKSQRTPFTKE